MNDYLHQASSLTNVSSSELEGFMYDENSDPLLSTESSPELEDFIDDENDDNSDPPPTESSPEPEEDFMDDENDEDSDPHPTEPFPEPELEGFMYDENSDPPLSTDRFNPTFVGEVEEGTSTIRIVIDNQPPDPSNPTGIPDRNYFTITVPEGLALTQLILADYIPGDDAAFIGLQEGTQFTISPTTPSADELLGYTLVGIAPYDSVNEVGDDLLPSMGLTGMRPLLPPPRDTAPAPNPIGFTSPLLEGDYVFWVQQTTFTPLPTELQLNFVADEFLTYC